MITSLLDDSSLASAAADDPQAFADLYDRYVGRIYAYAFHRTGEVTLAEDVTSATFEKALHHLRRKGWQQGSFLAWLYRIARNETIQQYRKNRRLVDLPDHLPGSSEQEPDAARNQAASDLREALARLPAHDQEVLGLRFFEGLTSAETAEILDCGLPQLYLQVHRALQRLRKELEPALAAQDKSR